MIPSDQPHLTIASQSHAGETGKNNEDAFSTSAYRLEADQTPSLLAVVADGIGGHQAGEIASGITIETAVRHLAAANGRQPVAQLRAAVVDAGRAVAQAAMEAEERAGMGSTIAVAWIIGLHLYTATVGDSRIYHLRQGRLRQLSIDHTWIATWAAAWMSSRISACGGIQEMTTCGRWHARDCGSSRAIRSCCAPTG
jgi:protein phosphatase